MRFFDSNVLIAGSVVGHPHHERSRDILADMLRRKDGACGAHTLAEVYANLTKEVRGYSLPTADAAKIIEHTAQNYKIVALTSRETVAILLSGGQSGFVGSLIYDALLIGMARKIEAKKIYTHNVRHFLQVAPDLASRIVTP